MTGRKAVFLAFILLIFAALFALAAPAAGILLSALHGAPVSAPSTRGWVGVLYLLYLLVLLLWGVRDRGGAVLTLLGVYGLVCLTLLLLGLAAMATPVFWIGFLFLALAGFLILPIFTLHAYLVPALIGLAVLLLSAAVLFWLRRIRPRRAKRKENERLWQEERRECLRQLSRQGKDGR